MSNNDRPMPNGPISGPKDTRNDPILRVGDTYATISPNSSDERHIFRLVHRCPQRDIAWVIRVPGEKSTEQYTLAPVSISLSELTRLWIERQVIPAEVIDPPIYMMNDDEIRAMFTNKNGKCPALEIRNERYAILQKLIDQYSISEILERELSKKWVSEQAKLSGKSRAKLYNIFHCYLAANFSKNALLPAYWRSGAKGQERKQRRKLGRPNVKIASAGEVNTGYALKELDKKKLHLGWRYFLGEGRTRKQAYLETMVAFYSERVEVKDGKQTPILLPTDLRPTPAQFDRWGPDGNPRLTASRIQLGEIDWAKKYKGISGSAKDGILAVGMQAVCDTTTNDAYLKSLTSRLKTVGPVNRLLITECKSELIIGLHCSFDAPSAKTFLLAVAHGASSKVDFCARYGITISDEDWPACAARTYLGDNGEYRNQFSQEALRQFGSHIDNIPSGQPQFNGTAESKHHVLHARLDHTLDGTTHGQPRRRGKPHPAIDACANYHEYMRELIIETLYHNNEERVPHLLSAEMRRDRVEPTRISIYRWLTENGYVVDFTPNIASLRAHLYPLVPATLTESGVYLLREDMGTKEERIPNARYMGDALIQFGLLEKARRKGNSRITVRCNPMEPSSVWIQTDQGLAELKNIHPDPIIRRQATLADLVAIKNEDKIAEIEYRGQDEQRRVEITAHRQMMLSEAQTEKQGEMAALAKPMRKADHYSELGKNRQDEIEYLKSQSDDQSIDLLFSPKIIDEPSKSLEQSTSRRPSTQHQKHDINSSQDSTSINPALSALLKHMKDENE